MDQSKLPDFLKDELAQIKDNERFFKKRIETIHKLRGRKKGSYYLYVTFMFFYYSWVYVYIKLKNFLNAKKVQARWLGFWRRQLKVFFYFRGIRIKEIAGMPNKIKKPIIVLVPQYNPLTSLLIHAFLKFTLIMPLSKQFWTFRLIRFWRATNMGAMLKMVSYEKADLNVNIPDINKLLGNGYPVMVHINKNFLVDAPDQKIRIYEEIKDVLAKPFEVYIVRFEGMEQYVEANFFGPLELKVEAVTKTELLKDIDMEDQVAVYQKLAAYLGFSKYELV